MKVLLTGATGQLGHALIRSAPATVELVALDRAALDLARPEGLAALIEQHRPALLINAAAYTAVDRAEQEPELAQRINAQAVAALAAACSASAVRLMQISTDFVFDGRQSRPYRTEDPPAPLGVYGASKQAAEALLLASSQLDWLIIRTAWVYASHGSNFVKTMLRLMAERDSLGVVADQIGTPTHAATLARAVWSAAGQPALRGIHHYTDAGVASWYDFAVAIMEEALALGLLQRPLQIRPITTADYPTPARRPAYSVLDKQASWAAFGFTPDHWRVELRTMLKELQR